ncbi:MAG: hypothetical protein C4519_21865 [Desulfobacteraceae bacterium]|nr:MAG: hypothetical protein C4519_21865 [Desulfobacteraceae bacterium]
MPFLSCGLVPRLFLRLFLDPGRGNGYKRAFFNVFIGVRGAFRVIGMRSIVSRTCVEEIKERLKFSSDGAS